MTISKAVIKGQNESSLVFGRCGVLVTFWPWMRKPKNPPVFEDWWRIGCSTIQLRCVHSYYSTFPSDSVRQVKDVIVASKIMHIPRQKGPRLFQRGCVERIAVSLTGTVSWKFAFGVSFFTHS